MTVKDLVTRLLDFDMDEEVSIEYPSAEGLIVGNYSRYSDTKEFEVKGYSCGVIIGVET